MSHDTELREAIALLDDPTLDLIEAWEQLRPALASLLTKIQQTPSHQFDDEVDEIVSALLDKQGEQHIHDPLEDWVFDTARQLGLIEMTASRSRATADALKKLFRIL